MRNAREGAILVVEDDGDLRAVLAESLADEGHKVVTSDLGALPTGDFSVVLTDVPYPPYDARETRRWIDHLHDRYAGARVMLCTAQRAVHRELDVFGADCVLDMPFDLSELFVSVARLVRGPAAGRSAGRPGAALVVA